MSKAKATLAKSEASEKQLFYIEPPADRPGMDPDPRKHLEVLTDHLGKAIEYLQTVDGLAEMNDQDEVTLSMSYGVSAVILKLQDIRKGFDDVNLAIQAWTAEKGGV